MTHVVYLTRTESFCAAHRLHSARLSEAENARVYGKCNHGNFHGHNYTLCGTVDPDTGMVVNLVDIKDCISESVLAELDHKNLDLDVKFFNNGERPSTAENIAVYIWGRLCKSFAARKLPARLHEIVLRETEKNSVCYRGPEPLAVGRGRRLSHAFADAIADHLMSPESA